MPKKSQKNPFDGEIRLTAKNRAPSFAAECGFLFAICGLSAIKLRVYAVLDRFHSVECAGKQLIKRPAEHFGALFDNFARTACGKLFVLILLFQAFKLHILAAL